MLVENGSDVSYLIRYGRATVFLLIKRYFVPSFVNLQVLYRGISILQIEKLRCKVQVTQSRSHAESVALERGFVYYTFISVIY